MEFLVAFDGGCPACRREIGHYRRLRPLVPLRFVDATHEPLPADAPPREALLARLHVRDAQGRWLSGAAAFVGLWQQLPGWRWAAQLTRLPGLLPLMEWTYSAFLRVRPLWRKPACSL